jgi:thiopeptide-type bacteriocin biosynthesis protein
VNETSWKQVTIAYPGLDRQLREQQAIAHLTRVMPAAEADRLITSWWFIRKGRWRIRYLLAGDIAGDPLHPLLTSGVTWNSDVYEPELHAFGGPESMNTAHALFHRDSSHLATFLHEDRSARRERSLILCTALMRAAGLDLHEQGDVWAQIAAQRSPLAGAPPPAQAWESFIGNVRCLLTGNARTDQIGGGWLTAFEETGRALRALRETGRLTRGIRAIIALHVIFHWNRLGLPGSAQALLARAASQALLPYDYPVSPHIQLAPEPRPAAAIVQPPSALPLRPERPQVHPSREPQAHPQARS